MPGWLDRGRRHACRSRYCRSAEMAGTSGPGLRLGLSHGAAAIHRRPHPRVAARPHCRRIELPACHGPCPGPSGRFRSVAGGRRRALVLERSAAGLPAQRAFEGRPASDRGVDGPLQVYLPDEEVSPVVRAYMAAGNALGVPAIADHNGRELIGTAPNSLTIRNGRRLSVADAYLPPEVLSRPNLTLITDGLVERILSTPRWRRASWSRAPASRKPSTPTGSCSPPGPSRRPFF